MRILIILIISSFITVGLQAQNRTDHPLQVQLNLSGLAIKAMGDDLRERDVIDLEVKEYAMPGLSLGYHLTSSLYVGYSFHANRRYILRETYSFNNGPDDIMVTVDHNSGTFHTLEGRISPFPFGLYGSAFFTHVSRARYDLSGVPISDSYEIGENVYQDAISAEWDFKDMSTLGLGLGWNQVFSNGLSFNVGAGIPIRLAKDLYDDVQVINEDSEFTESDIRLIQSRLQDEDYYFPVQFHLSIGKNF